MEDLDIVSYGISMTTLEEVFLKVNAELEEKTELEANLERGAGGSHRGSSLNRESG